MAKPITFGVHVLCILAHCCMILLGFGMAKDTLRASQVLSVGQTLISAGQIFELGFFSPGNSSRRYIGIWYKNISPQTTIWVANRESPLPVTDNFACLTVGKDGNLRLLDGRKSTIWSTNIKGSARLNGSTIATLSHTGNFILNDGVSRGNLWESFWYPCNVLLPGMRLGVDINAGTEISLRSWKSENDPSPGSFKVGLQPQEPQQACVYQGSTVYWRTGPWDGVRFVGVQKQYTNYVDNAHIHGSTEEGTVYMTIDFYERSTIIMMRLSSSGMLSIIYWESGRWLVRWHAPANPCDVYGACGQFAVCNADKSPICNCLYGFEPKSKEEWNSGNWSSGCVRRTQLSCQKNMSGNLTSGKGESDGFRLFRTMKPPDRYQFLYSYSDDPEGCKYWCLNNCSCVAYVYVTTVGCLVWAEGLIDMQKFDTLGEDLYVKLAHSELGERKPMAVVISLTATILIILIAITYAKLKAKQRGSKRKRNSGHYVLVNHKSKVELEELPLFEFKKVETATNNFNEASKLGEGGFGPVYKGKFEDGQEIAVKRLSRTSGQGLEEFMNEVEVISKLQHRNLVRLLGCCVEGEEKMLIYEYMPNKSLDSFLFDPERKNVLPWEKRFNIIQGICRGLLYLHRDSRLRIIHRDLKAGNILLDGDLNPKISDFGMARIFGGNQDQDNTRRIVGTYGYMSPEYANRGLFSEKSDVFSLGVLLLEIVSGMKGNTFWHDESLSLLGYAWKLWNEGVVISMIDPTILDPSFQEEIVRCIQVGLLCVQEFPRDRPNISTVISILGGEIVNLPEPKQPGFTLRQISSENRSSQHSRRLGSINSGSISDLSGR